MSLHGAKTVLATTCCLCTPVGHTSVLPCQRVFVQVPCCVSGMFACDSLTMGRRPEAVSQAADLGISLESWLGRPAPLGTGTTVTK